jgi:hypothetical protein
MVAPSTSAFPKAEDCAVIPRGGCYPLIGELANHKVRFFSGGQKYGIAFLAQPDDARSAARAIANETGTLVQVVAVEDAGPWITVSPSPRWRG